MYGYDIETKAHSSQWHHAHSSEDPSRKKPVQVDQMHRIVEKPVMDFADGNTLAHTSMQFLAKL